MFKKIERIEIESGYCLDFVECLGEIGCLEFRFGEEFYYVDDLNPKRKLHFRRWVVKGNKKDIERLYVRMADKHIHYRNW